MNKVFTRRSLSLLLILMLSFGFLLPAQAASSFRDVPEGAWYFGDVEALTEAGVIPAGGFFFPKADCQRGSFVNWLYGLHLCLGGSAVSGEAVFADVPADHPSYEAVFWAYKENVVKGMTDTQFQPEATLTRQQCCALLLRFTEAEHISLKKVAEFTLFPDAGSISDYAKSNVAAAQMAGLVKGFEDGSFRPKETLSNSQCAAFLNRLRLAAAEESGAGEETVSAAVDAYLSLYTPYDYTQPLPETPEAAASAFDNAVFIGDSVSLSLKTQALKDDSLGKAQFLVSGSLSANNALWEVSSESVHPTFQGVKMRLEDGVAKSGAKNVYILLGINDITYGLDTSRDRLEKLIGLILEKSPDVNIIVQSVTPISKNSTVRSGKINNAKIDQYNAKLQEMCAAHEWYFLNINPLFKDADGNLSTTYCSDPNNMGIHFTPAAAKLWIAAIKTHFPAQLG